MILGEVKARPKDIISFSLDYISKSKVQTSNPSSSPISLDTPARPADFSIRLVRLPFKVILVTRIWSCQVSVANVARAEHVSGPILAQPTTGMPF